MRTSVIERAFPRFSLAVSVCLTAPEDVGLNRHKMGSLPLLISRAGVTHEKALLKAKPITLRTKFHIAAGRLQQLIRYAF